MAAADAESRRLVEVERKCVLTGESLARLLHAVSEGLVSRQDVINRDQYFDTAERALMLGDCWLRCRGSAWELKTPVLSTEGSRGTARYTEWTGEDVAIAAEVRRRLGQAPRAAESMAECASDLHLLTWVDIETNRTSYNVPLTVLTGLSVSLVEWATREGIRAVHVDVDQCNFRAAAALWPLVHGTPLGIGDILDRYDLAELEICVAERGDVAEQFRNADQVLDALCTWLGIAWSPATRPRGKVSEYLARFAPIPGWTPAEAAGRRT